MSLYEQTFQIRGRELLPVVQGGMGIGISAGGLAGTVAKTVEEKKGAVGTIASVALGHLDYARAGYRARNRDSSTIAMMDLTALDREIKMAREICGSEGFLAVNVMNAITGWQDHVRQACESGANAIVMGAGLPIDLPKHTASHPEVALIPILSEARAVEIILKRWMNRYKRLPDAIVIEHPGYAGGHLGATNLSAVMDKKFNFPVVLPEIFQVFRELKIKDDEIPIICAGGINSPDKIRAVMALGARAVQIGTAFAVTEEGDAHHDFKTVLLNARPEDIAVFRSTAGLPARAVMTPWLRKYLEREPFIRGKNLTTGGACVLDVQCLKSCGLATDILSMNQGRFCILGRLIDAVLGRIETGLFFTGSGPIPFKRIVPVRELLEYLLEMPKATAQK